MNIAVILASGTGSRMGQDIPKQFLNVFDKPVIIWTLENFQKHPEVDAIEVVCLAGWEQVLRAYATQFGITKLRWIVQGGATAQESIRNGIANLKSVCGNDDIVIIHDGVRPLIDEFVISDILVKCRIHGNGVTSLPYNEQIFVAENTEFSTKYIPRDTLRRVSTPQAYRFEKISWAYEKAFSENIGVQNSTYANTLMVELGEKIYFAAGSDKNIKLTSRDDFELFKCLLKTKSDSWIK